MLKISLSLYLSLKSTMLSKPYPFHLFIFFFVGISWMCMLAVSSSQTNFTKFSRSSSAFATTKSFILINNPSELFIHSLQFSIDKANHAQALLSNLTVSHRKSHDTEISGGFIDCMELLDDTLDQLQNVGKEYKKQFHVSDDIQTWLSAALTNQETCLESLQSYESKLEKRLMDGLAQNLSQSISNSLSIYMHAQVKQEKTMRSRDGGGRRLLSNDVNGFPYWVERKILEASIEDIGVHAVVAKDGSGTHMTIGEALNELKASLAGGGGGGRTVIYIKAGTYNENIKIPTKQKNVMLVGDGKGKTIIVGSRNSKDGWTAFQSASVAAMGDGFIARDITFMNSAGPTKNQAVSLRVGSDKSVIFRCSILGYQDTLYTHSKRQFYRDTDICGTVDFIFGNSAVVFQNCNIFARKPLSNQQNFITAQGRINSNQNTGISIHNCKIIAASDLAAVKSKVNTYLGRPWKQHSRTVIMQSFLDDIVHPSGWSPWSGNFGLNTLYYGEYMNSGPGASIRSRVKWSSYHSSLTFIEAQRFTVGSFIDGNLWLPSTGVSFDSGLLS